MKQWQGPTAERIQRSDGYLEIGDDQQGTRVYHMLDSVLDRTYADLRGKLGSAEQDGLRVEYGALKKLHGLYEAGNLNGAIAPSLGDGLRSGLNFDHLAKTERQVAARFSYHRAKDMLQAPAGNLSIWQWTVTELVVIWDKSLIEAGYQIGCKSQTRAFTKAKEILRGAGERLADFWGMK